MFDKAKSVKFRRLFWLGIALIIGGSTAFALIAVRSKGAPGPPSTPSQDSNEQRLEAEVITLNPSGFEPSEITRPAGPFILALHNRSGLEQLMLRIDTTSGPRMREIRMQWEKSDWSDVVELPVGSYTVTEPNNPDWVLRLTITPR